MRKIFLIVFLSLFPSWVLACQGGIDANTQLMLHLDNNVTDASQNNFTVTNNNVTFSNTVAKFGYSGLFNGTSAQLSIPHSSGWDFGTADFTIDFWVYFNATNIFVGFFDTNDSVNTDTHGIGLFYNYVSATLQVYIEGNGYLTSWSPSATTWYHIAIVRYGTALTVYINGIGTGYTDSSNITNPNAYNLTIGSLYSVPKYYFNGYIDEFRISKGIARWTSNFTPPAYPYTTPCNKGYCGFLN